MIVKFMRFVLVSSTTIGGFFLIPILLPTTYSPYLGMLLGLLIGLLVIIAETVLEKNSIESLVASTIGLIVGLIVGNLIALTVSRTTSGIPGFLYPIVVLIFGYLGTILALVNKKQLAFITKIKSSASGSKPNVLDTSVIIDGRIADILSSGFLDGIIVIPRFVLNELQLVADSENPLKRTRGRRGLDILNTIRNSSLRDVEIDETDFPKIPTVDEKLLMLSKERNGNLVTNDYNLNKVAELYGVTVLNVNDLANSLKAIVLPGETMFAKIVKRGKERGQGVAYLDDGTMIVVEGGQSNMNQEITVMVSSVLQTNAGRMIFAKIPDENDKKNIEHLSKR